MNRYRGGTDAISSPPYATVEICEAILHSKRGMIHYQKCFDSVNFVQLRRAEWNWSCALSIKREKNLKPE